MFLAKRRGVWGVVKGDVLQFEWSEERVANKLGHAEQRFEAGCNLRENVQKYRSVHRH